MLKIRYLLFSIRYSLPLFLLLPGVNVQAAGITWLVPGARQNAMGGAFSSLADDS
jgi:hypothetical protein